MYNPQVNSKVIQFLVNICFMLKRPGIKEPRSTITGGSSQTGGIPAMDLWAGDLEAAMAKSGWKRAKPPVVVSFKGGKGKGKGKGKGGKGKGKGKGAQLSGKGKGRGGKGKEEGKGQESKSKTDQGFPVDHIKFYFGNDDPNASVATTFNIWCSKDGLKAIKVDSQLPEFKVIGWQKVKAGKHNPLGIYPAALAESLRQAVHKENWTPRHHQSCDVYRPPHTR